MSDKTTSRLSLTLPSALTSIDLVEKTALDFARRAGFDPDTGCNLAMVAREAAANAIIHGNRYDTSRAVTAVFEAAGNSLLIRIADEGDGIDVAAIPDPLAPENLLRASGRGIFLMRTFMDEVHFRQLSPGTEITLIKRRKQ